MEKEIIKEIFLLLLEIFKALVEILWEKTKYFLKIFWIRFFGYEEIPPKEKESLEEWGVTGESEWPKITEGEIKEPAKKGNEILLPPIIPDLPDNYGENRIVLMQRDPLCLFCYWEIQQNRIDDFMKSLYPLAHDAKPALRMYDVTNILFDGKNANRYFDIELVPGSRDWYIHLKEPNRSFCADVGFLTSAGTFHPLIRSNTVTTPRMCPSDIIDEKWIGIGALYEKVYTSMGSEAGSHVFKSTPAGWQKLFSHYLSSRERVD
ncbi:MAG: DUF4912 domain-containing protein [Planctomycetes bacterium]|nr:DUF4912 domain-containing protein [Planctomycetota bacterium]